MKIKDITEGWWDQLVGAFSPRSGNRYDTSRDYRQEDDLYLSKLQADVESGKIDPSKLATGDKQAINPDPGYWAQKQLDYVNQSNTTNPYNVLKPSNVNVNFGKPVKTTAPKAAQPNPMSYSGSATATMSGTGQTYIPATPKPPKPRVSVTAATGPVTNPDDVSTMSPEERRKYYNKQFKSGVKVSANRG